MRIRGRISGGVITLILTLIAAGCATAGAWQPGGGGDDSLCIDGLFIHSGQLTLEQVLERRLARRVPQWFDPGRQGPLVLVDGLAVDGIQRLAMLPGHAVSSVETLEGHRAVPEYGAAARDGAIVVVTKQGRIDGTGFSPGARPALYCGHDGS